MFDNVKRDVRRYCSRGGVTAGDTWFGRLAVCLTTPPLQAVLVFRLGAWVHRSVHTKAIRIPLKLLYMIASGVYAALCGIDIDPEAEIGGGLFIAHPRGILIGPVQMGKDCNIAHQVTVGRRADGTHDVPVIGDRVWIGVGSVLFGKIRIGDGVTIGPLSVVGRSLPPRVMVMGNPIRVLRTQHDNTLEIYGKAGPPSDVMIAPATDHAPAPRLHADVVR